MEVVGIDVGFGFTKAYNGKNPIIFKSLIGDTTDIQFRSFLGEEASNANLHITLNDKSYFLGNYAEQQSNIAEFTLNQEKLIENFVKILAITAAGICSDSTGPINVVTGLPVGYLKRDSRRLKEMIQGIHEITYHNIDGRDETKRVYTHAASAIAADLNRLWENDWDIDSIILSGGGSVELAEYLSPNIEGNVIPIPKNIDARFNNVQGYFKFGKYKWGAEKSTPEKTKAKAVPPGTAVKTQEDTDASLDAKQESAKQEGAKQDSSSKGLSWLRRQN